MTLETKTVSKVLKGFKTSILSLHDNYNFGQPNIFMCVRNVMFDLSHLILVQTSGIQPIHVGNQFYIHLTKYRSQSVLSMFIVES